MAEKRDLVRYKEVRAADSRNDQKNASQIVAADTLSSTQEDLQEFVLSQLKRIIHGDADGTWKDDFVGAGVPSLSTLSQQGSTPGPQGLQGEQGEPGDMGPPGPPGPSGTGSGTGTIDAGFIFFMAG